MSILYVTVRTGEPFFAVRLCVGKLDHCKILIEPENVASSISVLPFLTVVVVVVDSLPLSSVFVFCAVLSENV